MNELSSFLEAQEDCIAGSWQKYLQWLNSIDLDSMSLLVLAVSDPKTFQTIQDGDGNNRLRKFLVDKFKQAVLNFQAPKPKRTKEEVRKFARSLTHFGSINDQYSGANSTDPLASIINHSSTSHSTKRSPTVVERPATAKERYDTGAKSIARRRPNDDDDQQPAGCLKPTPAPTFTQPRPTLAKKSATGVADLQSQNQSQHVPNALEEDEDYPVHNALFPSSPVSKSQNLPREKAMTASVGASPLESSWKSFSEELDGASSKGCLKSDDKNSHVIDLTGSPTVVERPGTAEATENVESTSRVGCLQTDDDNDSHIDFASNDPFEETEDVVGSATGVDPAGMDLADAAEYPKKVTLTMLDRIGDPSGKLVVYIKQKEHDPTAKTSEELSRRIVVAISDDASYSLKEGIIRACIFLHWDNRDVADLAVDRLLNLLSEKEFPPGFERSNIGPWLGLNRKDFAYWLGSKLESYQSFTVYKSGGDQNEHIVGRGSPMFDQSDLLMNSFRAKWSYSNTMIEHRFLNIEKNCHHVNADEMVLISEDGSRMSARSFYSRGGEPQTNFSHWEHRPELVDEVGDEEAASFDAPLTVDQANASMYRRRAQQYRGAMEDMTNMDGEEYLCYIAGCINESIRSTTFGVATLTQIIDKYVQEAFKFLKEARPDLSLPDKESLLKIVPGLRMVHGGSNVNVESTGALEVPSAGDTAQVVTGGVNADVQITEEVARKERRMPASSLKATTSTSFNIRDLRATAKSKHLDLVKRIEEAKSKSLRDKLHLIFGEYNVWSLMNIAMADFSRGKSSVRVRERQLKALLLLMEDRSTANGWAKMFRLTALEAWKKAELKSIDDGHISMDLSEPASSLLTALQEEEEEEEEGEQHDAHDNSYHAAAESAQQEAGIDADWIDIVKFAQQMKNSMHRDTLGIIMCRVMQMVPFESIAKLIKNENTIAFLDKKLSDWRGSKRSIADAWDSLILPSLQDGTPNVDMIEAYRLAVFISQRLTYRDFEEYFQKAESIPLNQIFEECDAAQCLRRCKSDKRKSYFLAEDSNGNGRGETDEKERKKIAHVKSVLARNRRLTATRSYLLPATFTCAVRMLRDLGILSEEDVSTSIFGINRMAASKFITPTYKILWDEEKLINLQRGDKGCIESLIKDISGLGEKAAKAFESDYIILDLTEKSEDDTSKTLTLERLDEYYRLCIPSDSSEGIEV